MRSKRRAADQGGGSRIHEGLVGARVLVGTPYLADPALRSEYEQEIAPRTTAALSKVLAEVFPLDVEAAPPSRILDLGAGTGAVASAIRQRFGGGPAIVEVDQVATRPGIVVANLSDAEALPPVRGSFDLVVSAHVLNELLVYEYVSERRAERLAHLVRRWSERFLAPEGRLILLEPALRETSRVLLAVRDRLVAAGMQVVAPCFFRGPCPALALPRDWCHDSTSVPGQASSGGRARRVDFSYLVLARPEANGGGAEPDPLRLRVVSDPLPEKGRLRLFVCGPTGRHELVRLDRHRSDTNAELDRLTRGDVARVSGHGPAEGRLVLDAAASITREPSGTDRR